MRLLLELSGEHPTLPAAEALAVLRMGGEAREVAREGTLLEVDAPHADAAFLAARLGLCHRVGEALGDAPPDEAAVLDAVEAIAPRVGERFRVRAHRVGPPVPGLVPQALERAAGAALAPGRKVAFEGPADEVRILLGERVRLARLLHAIDRSAFDARHVRHRPFFQPVSLHPRFCRAMVNLARVRVGERVADPFAGTGGLLLEAGLVGARVAGADLDPDMAQGARGALAHYKVEGEVLEGDVAATLARLAPLDAIVSDPPYGRASTTAREPPAQLYRRALAAAEQALRAGGRLVVVLPSREAADLAPPGLRLEQAHVQRVHRSLDRHYLVFRRT